MTNTGRQLDEAASARALAVVENVKKRREVHHERVSYTTSHSIAWGANFKGVSTVTPTATAGAVDIFSFRYSGTNMELVGYSLNAGA